MLTAKDFFSKFATNNKTLEQYEETDSFFNAFVGSNAVGNGAGSAGAIDTNVFS